MDSGIVVAVVTAVGSLVGILVVARSSRSKTNADVKTALDARIDARVSKQLADAWTQIDAQGKKITDLEDEVSDLKDADRRKMAAVVQAFRIIDEAAEWRNGQGPNLDPRLIAEIEDTIPPKWLRRVPTNPTPIQGETP